MMRKINFVLLLIVLTVTFNGLALAQWDADDGYYQSGDGAQAQRYGYQNGYRDGEAQSARRSRK